MPPNHSVVRPSLLLGRKMRRSRAFTRLDSGSFNAIGSYVNSAHTSGQYAVNAKLPRLRPTAPEYYRPADVSRQRVQISGYRSKNASTLVRNCFSISSLEPSRRCSVTCGVAAVLQLDCPCAYLGHFFGGQQPHPIHQGELCHLLDSSRFANARALVRIRKVHAVSSSSRLLSLNWPPAPACIFRRAAESNVESLCQTMFVMSSSSVPDVPG